MAYTLMSAERKRAEEKLEQYAADLEVAKLIQEEHTGELARLVEELAGSVIFSTS